MNEPPDQFGGCREKLRSLIAIEEALIVSHVIALEAELGKLSPSNVAAERFVKKALVMKRRSLESLRQQKELLLYRGEDE